jgi:hypothetical protein
MKGVGFGGQEDKQYAISPHHFSDVCYSCDKIIAEAQPFRLDEKVAGRRRHTNCPELRDSVD